MKKNILIALVALLCVALNGKAQNNTYNMVIEMANGTKITIGPNDVRNISFNDGELVMTGEDLNALVEKQSQMDVRIDSLAATDKDHHEEALARFAYYYTKEEINILLSNYYTLDKLYTKEEVENYVASQISVFLKEDAIITLILAVLHNGYTGLSSGYTSSSIGE